MRLPSVSYTHLDVYKRQDKASALEDAIQDSGGQVVIMQYLSPIAERFIGSKDHGSFSQVAIVDDMKQDIGGIGTVG